MRDIAGQLATRLRDVRTYPEEGVRALFLVGHITFGWLHDIAEDQGILN